MKKVLLIILDGFGEGKDYAGNAITRAKTPTLDELRKKYPWTLLKASGEAVGLPKDTQGGSEVGHFTIGAGRVVFQSLEEINRSIRDKSFFEKPALLEACKRVNKTPKAALHLLGMISDPGVHSHLPHMFALLELAKRENVKEIFIHAITDGRDVHERSADGFIKQIQDCIRKLGLDGRARIATIVGRYFAMDRDTNWDRTEKAYDLYTLGTGIKEKDPLEAIRNAYKRGIKTDYYIDPIILDEHGAIKNKDSVIFWNYRTDRARQLTWAFTGENDPQTGRALGFKPKKTVRPYFVCMGPYSEEAPVVFPAPIVKNNLGETISRAGLAQLRIAETEKYAHVTFFFNSQIEEPYPGEERLLIDSPKCPSYAEKPEMSAHGITDAIMPKLDSRKYAFIALNFANCDLVGHSGDFKATVKAVETIDECLGRIVPAALQNDYSVLITGDHGNAEYMIYEENEEQCPSHTTNPVPLVVAGCQNAKLKPNGELENIAPTILKIMGVSKPEEMTGESLI